MRCRICGNEAGNTAYHTREMMLGLRHEFDYFQCAACDCLQITEFPADMTPYYPSDYIGFGKLRIEDTEIPGWAVTMWELTETISERMALQTADTPSSTIDEAFEKTLAERAIARYLPDFVSKRDARILDVGCGDGGFIHTMGEIGFANVVGVDLFIHDDIDYDNGVKVRKGTIRDVEPAWDMIMLHHSFEHMPDPLETMQAIAQDLAPDGVCMIRIPIASSYAWETYRKDWIQMDPPRHFFLHSLQSLDILAKQAGLRLDHTLYDSNGGIFGVSEMYQRDISLAESTPMQLFSPEKIRADDEHAKRLNEEGRGDQAAFYFVRAD
jgi:SAM-dependent methyltransferase